MSEGAFSFAPELHESELLGLISELEALDRIATADYERALRRHPRSGGGLFSKSEVIRGFRHLNRRRGWRRDERAFIDKIRMKPVRTLSGVAPVTVLTRPYPCPGRCIFCPSDVRMPKSYLSDEPGAQRAAQHQFDPYLQSISRLRTYHNTGHRSDKVELIVLGGTWSSYPEEYQIWFVKRCFDAMNDFARLAAGEPLDRPLPEIDFRRLGERVDGRRIERSYNRIVREFAERAAENGGAAESATWEELERVQRENETAAARCVGLVVETRPDHLTEDEVRRIRRLGATKVQIGFQSLSDEVLAANRRGHDVAATRRAVRMLRGAGFKIHAHWMPNLYGSDPERDVEDYRKMFDDPDFRPDELKIYPCSLIESAELMAYHEDGRWRPYGHEELLHVLRECLLATPEYCRLTRVIRDIPGTDIVTGNKLTNFRQVVERDLRERGLASRDIRAREIRRRSLEPLAATSQQAGRADLQDGPLDIELRELAYETSTGTEIFLQFVTAEDRLAAFLRLSLPREPVVIEEIAASAMIREVHVYGLVAGIGERGGTGSQHLGLGRRLIERAAEISRERGFGDLAVISSVGTREYYRRLGFGGDGLYQHRAMAARLEARS